MHTTHRLAACGRVLAASALLLLCACANQAIHFSSEPSGATITVNGRSESTPCTLRLPHGSHQVQVVAPSGERQDITVYSGMNPTAASVVANTLQGTGQIFLVIGHIGTHALHGSHSGYDAVIRVGVGIVGLGSLAVGNALTRAGDYVADLRSDGAPPRVHVVFPVATSTRGRRD